jgi:DNA processing protein
MNRTGLPTGSNVKLLGPELLIDHREITPRHPEWPAILDELGDDAPRRLHVSGQALEPGTMNLAIVGSRRPTAVGMAMAERFGSELAEAGFTIVSGLATGIDAIAHKAALAAGGRTIAVIGCGLDVDYPHRNLPLRRLIDQRGSVLSEYAAGTPPHPRNFPERNRIVAGMCSGVIVIEGGEKSGALITARLGLDYDRLVFAVPGSPWNPMAAAPNALIRSSRALLVTEPEHVFEEVAPKLAWAKEDEAPSRPKAPELEDDDVLVLHVLTDQPLSVERVARCAGIPSPKGALALSRLCVRGFAARSPIGYRITASGASALAAIVGVS